MMLSTGIIPVNTSAAKVEEMLVERAEDRGYEIDPATISINIPREGMKVAVCMATKLDG